MVNKALTKFSDLKKILVFVRLSVFEATAIGIAQKTNKIDLVPGCSPISVAAAVLFMTLQASDAKKSLEEIAGMNVI